MPQLVFHIEADYQKVIQLRTEIKKLEAQMQGFTAATPRGELETTAKRLTSARLEFNRLTTAAARAGAEMETDFRSKMKAAAQSIDGLTQKIIEQKRSIHQIESVLAGEKRLQATLKKAGTEDALVNSRIKENERLLRSEKSALFDLSMQQSEARSSLKKLSDEYKDFNQQGKSANDVISGLSGKISKWTAGLFAVDKVKDFIGQMISVRGQFQAADTAIETLLGSKSKADQLMSQVREYAKISPLEFSDVTSATQMMLGFNIEAEKVPKFLSAIGDVSMGNSQKFNSLTLAFSQMSAAGKLMGQDLNQMINAGFNPLQQMSQTTGKSIAELKKQMSDGAISAEMVQQAFIDATSEGGKFFGMSENGSKTINGQMSMLQDAVDLAFNEMGEKSEGVIMDAIELATKLITNYETIGKILIALGTAYGTYRAALLMTSAVEKARQSVATSQQKEVNQINARTAALEAEIAKRKELLAVMSGEKKKEDSSLFSTDSEPTTPKKEAEANNQSKQDELKNLDEEINKRYTLATQAKEEADQRVKTAETTYKLTQEQLQKSQEDNDKAQEALAIAKQRKEQADERVKSAQDYLDVIKESSDYDGGGQGSSDDEKSAYAELQAAMQEQLTAANEMETASEAANSAQKELNAATTANQTAATRLQTATEVQSTATTNLHTATIARETIAQTANTTSENLGTLAKIKARVATTANTLATKVSTTATLLYSAAINSVKNAWNAMKIAMATNPIGAIITVITTAISLLMMFKDSTEEASEAEQKFGEEAAKTLTNVNALYAVVNSASKESQTYKQSMQELTDICEQYGIQLDKEKDLIGQVNEARQTLNYLIAQEGVERQHANAINEASETYQKEIEKTQKEIASQLGDKNGMLENSISASLVSVIEAKGEELKSLQDAIDTEADGDKRASLQEEYNRIVQETILKTYELAEGEKNLGKQIKGDTLINMRNLIQTLLGTRRNYEKSIEIIDKSYEANKNAIDSTYQLDEAHRKQALAAKASKTAVADLASEIDKLIKDYGTTVLTIKTKFETEGIPQWMKEKYHLDGDTKQSDADAAKRTALYYKGQAEDMKNKKVSRRYNVGTKRWISQEDMLRAAAESTAAAAIAQDRVDAKKDKNTPPKNNSKSPKTSGETEAEKQEKTRRKIAELNRKYAEEESKQELKYANQNTQTYIDQLADGGEKERMQRALDHQKNLQEIDDEAEDIRKKNVEKAKAYFEADYKNKDKDFYQSDEYKAANKLTEEDESYLQSKYDSENARYKTEEQKVLDEEQKKQNEAMRSYLKEYGTYQQQRLAIAQEYAEKIAKAETEGERLKLRAEEEKSLADFDNKQLKSGVDWEHLFGDVSNKSQAQLQGIKSQLKDKLAEKTLSIEDYKTIVEQIEKVNSAIIEAQTSESIFFGSITQHAKERKVLELQIKDATDAQTEAMREAAEASQQLANAKMQTSAKLSLMGISGYDSNTISAADAQKAITEASDKYGADSSEVATLKTAFDNLATATTKITSSQSKLKEATDKLREAEEGKKKTTLKESVEDVKEKYDNVAQNVESLPELISALGISEDSGVGKVANGLASAAGDVSGAMSDFASGNYIGALTKGISAIMSVGDIFAGGNLDEVANRISSLEDSNAALQKAVELNTEALNDSNGGIKSIEAAEKAAKSQKKINEQTLKIAHEQARAWKGGFGGYRSWVHYWKGFSSKMTNYIKENILPDFNGKIWTLSPEDMQKLLADESVRQRIGKTGKKGTGWKVLEKLDVYAALAGKIEEITDTLKEHLTQTTFDDLRSSFIDTLMDMESDADDFSDDFSKMLMQSILNARMADLMDDDIQAFYDKWADYAKSGNELTEDEMQALQNDYASLVEQGLALRDQAAAITGYTGEDSNEQSGETKSWESMGQDTADELNGRFTALQIAGESIDENVTLLDAKLDQSLVNQQNQTLIVDEMRTIFNKSYLELQSIRENTEEVIRPIKDMAIRLDSWDDKIKRL